MIQTIIMGHLVVAAIYDLRFRKVPNVIVASLGFLGLAHHVISDRGIFSITGIVCAFLLTLIPTIVRGMGMGDQKLLMAVGAWIGGYDVYHVFLISLCLSMLPIILVPNRWMQLCQNLYSVFIGWSVHKQVWLPTTSRSAMSQPFALAIFVSYGVFLLGDFYQ